MRKDKIFFRVVLLIVSLVCFCIISVYVSNEAFFYYKLSDCFENYNTADYTFQYPSYETVEEIDERFSEVSGYLGCVPYKNSLFEGDCSCIENETEYQVKTDYEKISEDRGTWIFDVTNSFAVSNADICEVSVKEVQYSKSITLLSGKWNDEYDEKNNKIPAVVSDSFSMHTGIKTGDIIVSKLWYEDEKKQPETIEMIVTGVAHADYYFEADGTGLFYELTDPGDKIFVPHLSDNITKQTGIPVQMFHGNYANHIFNNENRYKVYFENGSDNTMIKEAAGQDAIEVSGTAYRNVLRYRVYYFLIALVVFVVLFSGFITNIILKKITGMLKEWEVKNRQKILIVVVPFIVSWLLGTASYEKGEKVFCMMGHLPSYGKYDGIVPCLRIEIVVLIFVGIQAIFGLIPLFIESRIKNDKNKESDKKI